MVMPDTTERRVTFRRLHADGFFILPNAWDQGSAVRLQALGFPAIATTRAGAAWARGKRDGELGLAEVLGHLRLMAAATDLPVNADFENGFADEPADVAANVSRAVATGVAGLSVEDWSGTAIYGRHLAVERISAARTAIDAIDPQTMLIGRCEHFRSPDMTMDECIDRAAAYAAAGADCVFVPMVTDPVALEELVAAVAPKPVSVLLPSLDTGPSTFARLGVRRCSTGGLLAAAAWAGFEQAALGLKAGGHTPAPSNPTPSGNRG
jgi:2-methylisocitrate lyase-like PEP mutase family enzyme